jgi:hypothetical protein
VAVGLLALGEQARRYSAELKPYSTDLAVLLAMLLGARSASQHRRRLWALAGCGVLAPWLSEAAPFALAGAAAALALHAWNRRSGSELRVFSLALLMPFASQLAAIAWALHNQTPEDLGYLRAYWGAAFPPLAPGPAVHWLRHALGDLLWESLNASRATLAAAVVGLGLLALARRRREDLALLLAPLITALVASALRLYPFEGRLLLVLAPLAILGAASLVGWFAAAPARFALGRIAAALVALALLAPPLRSLLQSSDEGEELRPVLEQVVRRLKADEFIYVYYASRPAFHYYAPRLGILPASYRLGRCAREQPNNYLSELETLRGQRRVWLVLSHPYTSSGVDEQALFLSAFSNLGKETDRVDAPGAFAALYEIRPDAPPLQAVPLPGLSIETGTPRPCYGTVGNEDP